MDVICQAKSGMGKTAVFVLTTLQQIDISESGNVLVLCLCHTRELAHQINKEFERFSKYLPDVRPVFVRLTNATFCSRCHPCVRVRVTLPLSAVAQAAARPRRHGPDYSVFARSMCRSSSA